MLFYVVIPGFILLWWYATIKALTQRAPETIGDFIFLFAIFIVIPIGYGYFLWRKTQPNKTQQANLESLVDDLCNFASSDNYIRIDADLTNVPDGCMGLNFNTPTSNAYYSFYQHGYAPVKPERMPAVFNALRDRLDGYITVDVSHFGEGYAARKTDSLHLLLGDAAKSAKIEHQKYMASKTTPQTLKKI